MKEFHYKGLIFTQDEVNVAKQLIDLELGIITQDEIAKVSFESGIKAGGLLVLIGSGTETALKTIEKDIIKDLSSRFK